MNLIKRIGLMFFYILVMNGLAWVLSKINHCTNDQAMIMVLVGIVAVMIVNWQVRQPRSTGGTVI